MFDWRVAVRCRPIVVDRPEDPECRIPEVEVVWGQAATISRWHLEGKPAAHSMADEIMLAAIEPVHTPRAERRLNVSSSTSRHGG